MSNNGRTQVIIPDNELVTVIFIFPGDVENDYIAYWVSNLRSDSSKRDVILPLIPPLGKHIAQATTYVFTQHGEITFNFTPERVGFDIMEFARINDLTLYSTSEGSVIDKDIKPQRSKSMVPRRVNGLDYFKEKVPLNKREKAYCRCVAHVLGKNDDECNETRNWGQGKCYNPYAVCRSSVGTGTRHCVPYFNLPNLPDKELRAIAISYKIRIPAGFSKQFIIDAINKYKSKK